MPIVKGPYFRGKNVENMLRDMKDGTYRDCPQCDILFAGISKPKPVSGVPDKLSQR